MAHQKYFLPAFSQWYCKFSRGTQNWQYLVIHNIIKTTTWTFHTLLQWH